MRISRDHTWKSQSLRRIAQLQTRRMRAVSPSLCTSPQDDLQKYSKIYSSLPLLPLMRVFSLKKNPFFCYLSSSHSQTPMRAASPPLSLLFLFSSIYITPQDLNLFPKRKILLLPFFFSSFFKSSNQKQSSQFQFPLQNLPRRVPPSLNSNGKFPCKNMKFLKLNH